MTQLTQDVRTARSIQSAGTNSLVITDATGATITFTRSSSTITRNGADLSSSDIAIASFVAQLWSQGVTVTVGATDLAGAHAVSTATTITPRTEVYSTGS